MIIVVIIILGLVVCLQWHSRGDSRRVTPTFQGVRQDEIIIGKRKPSGQIARVERDVDGKEQQPGQLKDVKKKPENMEGLGQQLIQVKDVKKKPEKIEGLRQHPIQVVKDVKKKPENMEGLRQHPIQVVKDVKKKPENMEGLRQHPIQVVKDVKKKPENMEGLRQHPIQVVKNVKKKPEKSDGLGQLLLNEEVPVMPRDRGNKAGKQPQQQGVEDQSFPLLKFSYNYVRYMTGNFDSVNVIGKGGFAQVYKGTQFNGTPVAVKRLNQLHTRIDDFKNEVEALGRTSHFNLVKLIGYCVEDEHKMLVYEYMRNGPLENWIFGTNPKKTLSWLEKKKIILGIAKGLVYLHENCEKKILHRDLKPLNVLLDDKKNAKVCDFGISKLLERDQSSISTTGIGTPGYVAPEIMRGIRRISEKVDVYSFGVVVLEVVFGKPYYRLVRWNQTNLEAPQLPGLIKQLGDEMKKNGKDIERIGKLAIWCLSDEPEARPTMSDIVGAIKGADAKVERY